MYSNTMTCSFYTCTQGVKIKPVTMATNKAASLDEELGDITSYEFGEPITAINYIMFMPLF